MARPFLKWAGGKQWLAQRLAEILPFEPTRYYEPFLGGGSVFFHFQFPHASLSDSNDRLIETYTAVRDMPREVVAALSSWRNESKTYYLVREAQPDNPIERAAQFIYLNKTCWNGLYRVNSEGRFNVPFGDNGRSTFSRGQILAASRALQGCDLSTRDFEEALRDASPGDLVYLDPPYVLPEESNGFRRYNRNKFTWSDQERVSRLACELANVGCHVIVSNAYSQSVAELYPGFHMLPLARNSNLAPDPADRRRITELLILSFPLRKQAKNLDRRGYPDVW